MKKLLLSLIAISTCFMLFGCSMGQTTASIFAGSYFLADPEDHGVGTIDETSVYKVDFTKGKDLPEDYALRFFVTEGSYTTHVFTSEYEGQKCYRLDTELLIKGSYTVSGESVPVDDSITTTAYFLGMDNTFATLYAERTVKSHSASYKDGKYQVNYYDYKTETTYSGNSAKSVFIPASAASDGSYGAERTETTYEKLNDGNYFDNEMLLFAIRAMNLSSSTSVAFSSVDVAAKVKRDLVLSSDQSVPTEKLVVYFVNAGQKVTSIDTFRLNLKANGTYTGGAIVLNYASGTDRKDGRRLVKMETRMLVNLVDIGTFTYTLSSVTR